MSQFFNGLELAGFWEPSEYATAEYIGPEPTPSLIKDTENELGYTLPASYIVLMQSQNGGQPFNTCFPTQESASWAEHHVAITGFLGIGRDKRYSLCGEFGSRFMIEEWGYPDIGVYFGDCPSAGHDMIALDYRECGKDGEPKVVHVDQEGDYRITPLADSFELFVMGLAHDSEYEDDD